ncbi:MAG: hypothetical protein M3Y27_02815 [Acidobacteriota bacterium]|nr:hypothetical protein [Acidobacteriota bacterium]
MNNIICAIEQEIKYMQDRTGEGNAQYRAGYQGALRAVVEFLPLQAHDQSSDAAPHPVVKRLLSFLPPRLAAELILDEKIEEILTGSERELLRIALRVLRSNPEGADYLSWWLNTYGIPPIPSSDLLAKWPQPSNEEELNWLEKAFDLYGTVFVASC